MIPKITALHGFLGQPDDWKELFQDHVLQENLQAEDLFASEILDLWSWSEKFNINQHKFNEQVLLGYSLGGRLALHALLKRPNQWTSAIIISAHLGLNAHEKKNRLEGDEHWAKRFEIEPWDKVMTAWNDREVFNKDSFYFNRSEKHFSRKILATALRKWSLSKQDELHIKISELQIPILWIAGADDLNYAKQALELRLSHPLSEVWVVPETGHRVPWQRPEKFLLKITQFLEMVYSQHTYKGNPS